MGVKKKVPYSGRGFIPDSIKGPRELYDYLWSLTEDIEFDEEPVLNDEMRQKVHHFIAHVYNSIKAKLAKKDNEKKKDDGHRADLFIPTNSKLIDKKFGRDFRVLDLRDKALITLVGAKQLQHLSRYYSLLPKIWKTACKIENKSISDAWLTLTEGDHKKYTPTNIITGKRITIVNKNIFDPPGQSFKTPDLVKNAIKAISPCVINPKFVGRWVDYLEITFLNKKKEVQQLINTGNLEKDEIDKLNNSLFRLEKKYINERLSQATILYQQPELIEATSENGALLYEYRAAYKPQVSGRLTEIGGGMQNASRVFKYLAFEDVKDFYNYDLKASQANILMQELEKYEIHTSWISDYMKDPQAKTTYADRVGVDSDTWKTCLYATFMGANPNMPGSAIQNTLIDYYDDEDLAKGAVKRFKMVAKELLISTNKWRDKIISTTDSPYIYNSRKDGYRHWKNACGMKHKKYGYDRNDNMVLMEPDEPHNKKKSEKNDTIILKSTADSKRKLAAFILQGQEACFIHHLTLLCKNNDILVMKNEHDGIITNKVIPHKLISIASSKAKLPGAELDQKPLAGKQDIEKASRLIKKKIRYKKKE